MNNPGYLNRDGSDRVYKTKRAKLPAQPLGTYFAEATGMRRQWQRAWRGPCSCCAFRWNLASTGTAVQERAIAQL
jgi:hypothetical protein